MAKFSDLKKPETGTSDIKEIRYSDLKDGDSITVRIVGDIHPGYRYWITKKEGGMMPVVANGFNPETEEWDNIKNDPLYKLPTSKDRRMEFYYTVNCINRKDNEVYILPLKSTVFRQLYTLAQNPQYGDPADPDTGYDITITKVRKGPKPTNIEYQVLAARNNSPLTEKEKEKALFDLPKLITPRENYIDYIMEKSNILNNNYAYDSTTDFDSIDDDEDIPL